MGYFGLGLGIASMLGFIVSVVAPILGLALSIMAFKRDKAVGVQNTIAKVGIVLNAICVGVLVLATIGGIITAVIVPLLAVILGSAADSATSSIFDEIFSHIVPFII